jgi:sulfonate transport system substrate-binding protein
MNCRAALSKVFWFFFSKKNCFLALLWCVPAFAETPPSVIHLGGVGSGFGKPYGTGSFGIAQARHTIEDELGDPAIKLDWIYFTGAGPAINEALASGQLDFAQYGSLPAIIARSNGLATRFIMGGGYTNIYGMARPGLPIHSVADLKGHRVTLQKATILHWSLLTALHEAGLSDRDVTIVDLKTADQIAALTAGSVDAMFGTAVLLGLRDAGEMQVFYDTSHGSLSAAGPTATLVTEDFASRYPETTEKLVRGLVKAAHWMALPETHAASVAIWAQTGVPEKAIDEDTRGRPLREQQSPLLDGFLHAEFKAGATFAQSEKLTRKNFDVDAWFDPGPLDQALRETGLAGFWPRRSADGTVAQ